MKKSPEQIKILRFSTSDVVNIFVLIALCGTLAYLRWVKIDSLVQGDTPRWLFEAQRVATGQIPYRDFSWPYPPFSILLLGWSLRFFGVTFSVAQIFVDIVSFVVVLAAYSLVRLLLPRFLLLSVMFCFLAVCGTSLTFFNLFSLITYVPALQTGLAGIFILLLGILRYLRTGKMQFSEWGMVSFGAFVAAYSKPETFVAAYATILILALTDRDYWFAARDFKDWSSHYSRLVLACAVPAIVAYLWIGAVTGFSNMFNGLTGYGLLASACPWWPTGLGAFGVASSFGEAAFIAVAFSLARRKYFVARFGRAYSYLLAGGLVGACVYVSYVFCNNWNLLTGNRSIAEKIWHSGQNTFYTGAILLPVMWSCIALWLYLVFRCLLIRKHCVTADSFTILILLTGPFVMSARGWFNWTLDPRTTVPGVCYPLLLILGPYLLWRWLTLGPPDAVIRENGRTRTACVLVALLVAYGFLRVIGSYSYLLSDKNYKELSTLAGNVRLIDYQTNSEIYHFVLQNTLSTDTVLDIPYGGGINFAAHRLSPLFETQFQQVTMPRTLVDRDLGALLQHPPKLVIADNAPNYGVSYGVKSNGCEFPRLVWAPAPNPADDATYPQVAYLQKNYRLAEVVGRKVLLVPK